MKIEKIVVGIFQENCYVLVNDKNCVIIDPGDEPGKILKKIKQLDVVPGHIIVTHGHCDHIGANSGLKKSFPDIKICIHELDRPKLADPEQNLSGKFGQSIVSPDADILFDKDGPFSVPGFDFEVIHTPGHSKGSICLQIGSYLFAGDTLFSSSIGRFDFPDGNRHEIMASLKKLIAAIPESTVIFSGHGEDTDMATELKCNPFLSLK